MSLAFGIRALVLGVLVCAIVNAQTYDQYIAQARVLTKQQRFSDAWNSANSAVSLDGSRWEGYFVRGIADVGMQNPGSAIQDFQAAFPRAPRSALQLINKSIAAARNMQQALASAPNGRGGGIASPAQPAYTLSIRNSCRTVEKLTVALMYHTSRGGWVKKGWWWAAAGQTVRLEVVSDTPTWYVYAQSTDGREWVDSRGDGSSQTVVSDVFTAAANLTPPGSNPHVIKMFKVTAPALDFVEPFTCDAR